MNSYAQLSGQFQSVRRAWKRTAALSGLSIVIGESIGILALLVLLDWIYKPAPAVRVIMALAALGVIAWFFLRLVIAPFTRKISDEQIALYIEEHKSGLDGVLITAAEYSRGARQPGQEALVEAVLQRAAEAGAGAGFRQVVDFSRLRKYGLFALIALGAAVVLGALFPNTIGHRIGRVLAPWRTTAEDTAVLTARQAAEKPLTISLSQENANLPRGSTFDLEATLSQPAKEPVTINFRPVGSSGDWQQLPLAEIEKLNGYRGALTDISESLEYFVSTGETKTGTHKVTVFDPLVVEGIGVTIQHPAYAKLPDRDENPSTGDIEALEGSKAILRITGNAPLKNGRITWSDGATQNMQAGSGNTATVTIDVVKDGFYDFRIEDQNGQTAASPNSLTVRALPDKPPTVTVKSPALLTQTHPLGEVKYEADLTDDFGIGKAEIVFYRFSADGQQEEFRQPIEAGQVDPEDPSAPIPGTALLQLEDLTPPLKPEEVLSYNLEVTDTKGQKAVSEIGIVAVGYFETWATWEIAAPHEAGGAQEDGPDLMAMLKAVWDLDSQKAGLAADDLGAQSNQLADLMVSKETGALRDFVNLEKYPQLKPVAEKITTHAQNAHDALTKADTALAVVELRTAAAIAAGGKLLEDIKVEKTTAQPTSAQAYQSATPPMLTLLEQTRLEALNKAEAETTRVENDQNTSQASAAAAKALGDLVAEQGKILEEIKSEKAPDGGGALAEKQRSVAQKTKDLAVKIGDGAGAGGGQAAASVTKAVGAMNQAAQKIGEGKNSEAAASATSARKDLEIALAAMQNNSREKLAEAIGNAEARTAKLLADQRGVRKSTQDTANSLGANAPDQRQARDLQGLTVQQTGLRGEADALNAEIAKLDEWARQLGVPEASRALTETLRTIRRSKPEGKMGNAVVDLSQAKPTGAAGEQMKAEEALQKMLANLQASGDSLAADRDAQIRRAARTAAEAKQAATDLGAPEPKEGKGDQAANEKGKGDEGANEKGKGDQAANEKGKGDEGANEKGKGDKAANEKGKGDEGANEKGKGDQAANEKGKGDEGVNEKGKGDQAANEKGKGSEAAQGAGAQTALTPEERQAAAQALAYNSGRLATAIDKRDLADQEDIDWLKELSLDTDELAKRLLVDPSLLAEVSGVVVRINTKLEAEMEAKTEAKKLFASQREECPPAYRRYVNRYFEGLSKTGQAGQAAPATP